MQTSPTTDSSQELSIGAENKCFQRAIKGAGNQAAIKSILIKGETRPGVQFVDSSFSVPGRFTEDGSGLLIGGGPPGRKD